MRAATDNLKRCTRCRGLGDDLLRIDHGLFHGRCAFQRLGRTMLLRLPATERGKLRLADVGPALMRELIGLAEPPGNGVPPAGGVRPARGPPPVRDRRSVRPDEWMAVGALRVRTDSPLTAIQVVARLSPTRERGRTREGVEWMTAQAFQQALDRPGSAPKRHK